MLFYMQLDVHEVPLKYIKTFLKLRMEKHSKKSISLACFGSILVVKMNLEGSTTSDLFLLVLITLNTINHFI